MTLHPGQIVILREPHPAGEAKPILFTGAMVRAILAGQKTQTRRVVKPTLALSFDEPRGPGDVAAGYPMVADRRGDFHKAVDLCPHGQPGDLLWVKEGHTDVHPLAVQCGRYNQPGRAGIPGPPPVNYRTIYRADGEPLQAWQRSDRQHPYYTLEGPADDLAAKYPSIHSTFDRIDGKGVYWENARYMPKSVCRIFLRVLGVRVQRVQEISEENAKAEGVDGSGPTGSIPAKLAMGRCRYDFATLWDSIYAKRGYGWDVNPWVWAVTFERAEKPEGWPHA